MAYETQCGGCVEYDYQGESCPHQKPRGQDSSSNCYITTIICDKLGLEDDCGVLNTLRSFRDNIMQQDYKYCRILFEYDVIGPKISEMIKNDRDTDQELWMQFYNFYLLPTASLVKEEKYDEAVKRYTEMVNSLKEYYGIKEDIEEIAKDYDMTKGGHEIVKLLHQ